MGGLMRRRVGTQPLGVWIALVCLAFCVLVGGGGQALSFASWDTAVEAGFQEDRMDSPDLAERLLAHVEWGVAAGDVIVALPLFAAGLLGVILRRRWGWIAAMMGAACWIYMVPVYALQRWSVSERAGLRPWDHYAPLVVAFGALAFVPCLLAIWGLAANADLFCAARANSHRLRRAGETGPSRLEELLICSWQVLCAFFAAGIGGKRTWNVTPDEVHRRLGCDDSIAPGTTVDRAITIDRPPERVWPWIAQLGRGAAFYSWDFLDNSGHRHADYLIGVAEPAVGDWCKALGRIVRVEPGREVVWADESPFLGTTVGLAMSWRLDPAEESSTRLHFRMSCRAPRGIPGTLLFRVGALMDHVMAVEALRRLKLLAETWEERSARGETNCDLAPHQRDEWRPASPDSVVS